ncbi:hypothetical protein HanIR_Chr10g0469611 [Helianthus annuus]|nr:hypothetical protein HanIR_Chr10g0469611 [Helianthus annuus]
MSATVLPTGLVIRTGVPHHGLSQFPLGPGFRHGPGCIILPDMTNCGKYLLDKPFCFITENTFVCLCT